MASKSNNVSLAAEAEEAIGKFRSRRASFVVFKFNDDHTEIVVDKKGKRRDDIKVFCKALPENSMRLAIFNHEFRTDDGRITDKMFFIFWAPPSANTESKMRYSADKGVLRSEAGEGYIDLSVTNVSEIERACGVKVTNNDESEEDDEEWDPDA